MAKIRKDSRVNMRIHDELLQWAKEYALSKETTVTQIFIDHLTQLKEQQEQEKEQPSGT